MRKSYGWNVAQVYLFSECQYGTFGEDCQKSCGNCYNGTICNKKSGECPILRGNPRCSTGYVYTDITCHTREYLDMREYWNFKFDIYGNLAVINCFDTSNANKTLKWCVHLFCMTNIHSPGFLLRKTLDSTMDWCELSEIMIVVFSIDFVLNRACSGPYFINEFMYVHLNDEI